MKVILLKNVAGVGHSREVKEVSDGYARNYLIPRKLALVATASLVEKMALDKVRLSEEKTVRENLLMKNLKGLSGEMVVVKGKANEKGHLFAGIGKEDVASAVAQQFHLDVAPEHIILENPVKELGEYNIDIKIADKSVTFKLVVENIK